MSRVGTLIAAAIGSVVLLAVGVRQIKPRDAFVTYRANVPLSASSSLEASLPDIDRSR